MGCGLIDSLCVSRVMLVLGQVQEEADATMARLRTTTSLQDMKDADVVIEAVAENEGLKSRIFGELDKLLKPSAILASNTSSISIARLAASTQRPKQVI